MWRYSMLRNPGPLLSKDMKMKIYSNAVFYSSVGYVAEQCYIDLNMFVKPPYSQTPCCMFALCLDALECTSSVAEFSICVICLSELGRIYSFIFFKYTVQVAFIGEIKFVSNFVYPHITMQ